MRLILSKLSERECGGYLYHCNEPFRAWLYFHGIFIGDSRKHFIVDYNTVYDAYDIHLYEIKGNGDSKAHWQKVIDFLKEQGYDLTANYNDWRWEGKTRLDGVRIWIKAVE